MSDAVSRLNAALEGRYAIERELGEGGMATVYLAEDIKHERKVALKVLKPELAAVVGAERFLAEIKTTANLQHPHILPLFDSGEADGFLFYVMPYLEGESLRDRIDREKQLPVDEAVRIASAVANALDHAHRHKVIHRDIKPANILLQDGEPVVADFGIALAIGAAGSNRLTETGLSLGTPFYMSPEQATGDQPVGASTDTYALGSVLYEMLTGDPPYMGSTAQAVLGQIISSKPISATDKRPAIPANVDAVLRKALEKLPADRFTSAQDFAKALGDEHFRYGEDVAGVAAVAAGPWKRVSVGLGATSLVLAVALVWTVRSRPELPVVPLRMGLSDFEVRAVSGSGVRIAISRDGSQIAVASVEEGVSKLFVRRSDEREFRMLPGTEGATHPAFSPDGQWLAFTQDNGIKRIEVAGGPVLPVWGEGSNPHWGLDETIVIPIGQELYLVSPSGGEQVSFMVTDSAIIQRPFLLADGKAVVFQAGTSSENARLMLLEIGSGVVRDLGLGGNDPQYVSTGHLVYGHFGQRLMAVPFDLESHRVTGPPSTVATEVLVYGGGATQFAVSETGTAVFGLRAQGSSQGNQFALVDDGGVETLLPLEEGVYFSHPRFAPDGRKIVYDNDGQVGVYDLSTGENAVSRAGGIHTDPFWSRDGQYVYYALQEAAVSTLGYDGFRRRGDRTGDAEQLFRRIGNNYPLSLSPDETQLLVQETTPARGYDLVIMTDDGDSVTFTDYLRANWNEVMGTISPDGERVAYVSDESSIFEVYVRSFPDAQDRVMVSEGGGTEPVWAPDGSAIYYRDGARIMSAAVSTEESFTMAAPQVLFEGVWAFAPYSTNWDVHPDGESFLLITSPGAEIVGGGIAVAMIEVEVVVNWFEELKKRVPN